MKKFKLNTIAFLFVAAATLTSCSSDDDNNTTKPVEKTAFVTAVTGAETVAVNTELALNVAFTVDNACGAYSSFAETTATTTKTIEVKAKYEGKDCGTTPAAKTAVYKFKAAAKGTYVLKFKKSATDFVTHNVVVN